jgi:hypothetical protein
MKMGPDALRTAKNKSGRAKNKNGSRRPWYRGKRVWEWDPTPSIPSETSPAGNESGKRVRERKTRNHDPTPFVPPRMCQGAQNMKTGFDALGTAENESEHAKLENWTRHPPYRRN